MQTAGDFCCFICIALPAAFPQQVQAQCCTYQLTLYSIQNLHVATTKIAEQRSQTTNWPHHEALGIKGGQAQTLERSGLPAQDQHYNRQCTTTALTSE